MSAWSRVAFIAGLALVILAAVLPDAALQIVSPLDRLPRWLAALPIAGLVIWDVLSKNYSNVVAKQSKIRALQPVTPYFEFDFENQFIQTDTPGKVRRQAHWYRVRVRNRGTVTARNCMLRLECVADTSTGVVSGPLAVTGAGGASCDIAPDAVAGFDIGWCFENAKPGVFPVNVAAGPRGAVRKPIGGFRPFTEEQTPAAQTGSYRFAQDSPGATVWVDSEKGLKSRKILALDSG